jgi:hypothetical protein
MNDDEELIDEADVTPTPEPEDTPEPESMEADPVAQDDVELVDESDVETVNEGDVQALPEAPPPVAERTPMPASEALPLLAAQGATLGFRDELAGGIMGAVEGVKTLPQGPGAAFMAAREKYRQVSEAERAKTKAAREDFPVAGMATEMAGGFAVPSERVVCSVESRVLVRLTQARESVARLQGLARALCLVAPWLRFLGC